MFNKVRANIEPTNTLNSLAEKAYELTGYKTSYLKLQKEDFSNFFTYSENEVVAFKHLEITKARNPFFAKAFLCGIFSGVALTGAIHTVKSQEDFYLFLGSFLCFLIGVLSTCILIAVGADVEWRKTKISKYEKDLPEKMLKAIVDVKSKYPSLSLHVLELNNHSLLVGKHNRKQFYLEYWDKNE